MADEPKDLIQTINKSVTEMRELLDKVSDEHKTYKDKVDALVPEDKEKLEKLTKFIDEQDEKAQEMVIEKEALLKEAKEMEERVINLEGQIIKNSSGNNKDDNYKEKPEFKAFNKFVQTWDKSLLTPDELKYLRTDVGSEGGVLVQDELADDILKQIEQISDVRRLSRVRNRRGVKNLKIPVRTGIPTATYEGEAEEASDNNSAYGAETMTAHRLTVVTDTTRDILNFNAFDMESEIAQDAITAFAKGEGRLFLVGTSDKQPQGILDATSGITQETSVASGVVSMDDVIQLDGSLKVGYNAVYFFNKLTKTALRVEKDSNGNYLWRIGGESQPSTINDNPFVILQDMPDIAANSLSVGVGDFFRGYNILDSIDMELIRDDITQAKKAKVLFTWHKWNDGRVVLSEAFKLLKTKA